MSDIVNKMYWSKYRPKNIEGMILLPRIHNELFDKENNLILNGNYIFCGTPGIGKTSLAKIIVPKDALCVNASFNSSVEDLKDKVTEYCKTSDMFNNSSIGNYKIVYLDEFDGVSSKYQEALKKFIEDFEDRVRFIATCNNISKIDPALQSRFNVIKFNPINFEEENCLKNEYFERCKLIIEKNKIKIDDNQVKSLININFPDLRSVLNNLQRVSVHVDSVNFKNSSISSDFYQMLFNKQNTEDTYNWVIENFGDNAESVLMLGSRQLCNYILYENKTYINKIPAISELFKQYTPLFSNCIDPVVLSISYIYELQNILK